MSPKPKVRSVVVRVGRTGGRTAEAPAEEDARERSPEPRRPPQSREARALQGPGARPVRDRSPGRWPLSGISE